MSVLHLTEITGDAKPISNMNFLFKSSHTITVGGEWSKRGREGGGGGREERERERERGREREREREGGRERERDRERDRETERQREREREREREIRGQYLDTNTQKAFVKSVPGCIEQYRKLLGDITEAQKTQIHLCVLA